MALEKLLKPKAKERQKKGGRAGGKASGKLPEASEVQTRDQVAVGVGMSGRTWDKVKAVVEDGDEEIVAQMDKDGKVNKAYRAVRKKTAKRPKLPKGKFRVIYADPPWSYGDSRVDVEEYGPAERHYSSMTISELSDLDVESIAADDAVLFLWVTSPLLRECFAVIKSWGFKYKSSFVWDKVRHNYGHYNSVRHEFLLICTRGSCTPDSNRLPNSVQRIERTKTHSEKPEAFRKIIDKLYPHGRRVELFARRQVKGWVSFGNELSEVSKDAV